jgi:primosomal replication protein N
MAIKWMPKKNISNAAIHKVQIYLDQPSTQMEKGFSCTISQENIPITKYSNILKSTKT